MALVKCPECGREKVSDSAKACPDCGYGVKEYFDKIRQKEKIEREEQAKLRQEAENSIISEIYREEEKKAILEKIQENIKDSKLAVKVLLIWSVIWTIIGIVTIYIHYNDYHPTKGIDIYKFDLIIVLLFVVSLFFSVVGWFIFITFCVITNTEIKDFRLAQENIDEYKKVIRQRETESELMAKERARSTIRCPMCGSSSIHKISRVITANTIAIDSSNIGKQYQCYNCSHKW